MNAVGNISRFSPATYGNVAVWYDFVNYSYTDTGRTTLCTNGTTVAGVTDLSGNGRHLVQGTASLRPLYSTAIIPGIITYGLNKAAPQFDGVDDQLAITGNYTYPADMTVYAVVYTEAVATYQTIFGYGFDGTPNSNGMRLQFVGGNCDLTTLSGSSRVNDTQPEVISSWVRASGLKQSASGLTAFVGNTGTITACTPAAVSGTPLFIGARAAGSSCWNGYIAEVIAFEAAHTPAQMAKVWEYLRGKWGIA